MLVAPSGLTVHADVHIATLGAGLRSPRLSEPDTVSNATSRGSQSNHPAPVVLNSPHLTSTQTGEQHSGDIRKPSRISNCKRCKFGTNFTSYICILFARDYGVLIVSLYAHSPAHSIIDSIRSDRIPFMLTKGQIQLESFERIYSFISVEKSIYKYS